MVPKRRAFLAPRGSESHSSEIVDPKMREGRGEESPVLQIPQIPPGFDSQLVRTPVARHDQAGRLMALGGETPSPASPGATKARHRAGPADPDGSPNRARTAIAKARGTNLTGWEVRRRIGVIRTRSYALSHSKRRQTF